MAIALLVGLSACGSEDQITPLAVVASSAGSIGTGEQRVLVALVDVATNEYLAAEDRPATALLRDEDGTPLETYELDFVWTVPEVRGIYSARMDVPESGVYQLTVSAEGLNESGPTGFEAVDDPLMVTVEDEAPASETRTADEYPDLSEISSDPEPDPALYRLSVAEAVSNGTPAVILFATPAFCSSQACGPMLDQLKQVAGSYPNVDFIHVEVYDDLQVDAVEDLESVDAVVEWGLPSEPWLYVVDDSGVVSSAFEGAISDVELAGAIDAVTTP
jgi:hypothetical protein